MSHPIRIIVGGVDLRAELNASATAQAIYDALPLEAEARRWGDEIYFEIPLPLDVPLEPEATEAVRVGELAYWPPGRAFCVFFGPTPASAGPEPRAASAVNRVGSVLGDTRDLKRVSCGAEVCLEKMEAK